MRFPEGVIIQFAKSPCKGRVKTRLASEIGATAALELHCALVEHTLNQLVESNTAALQLWITGQPKDAFFKRLTKNGAIPVYQQYGADLGQRMANALDHALQTYSYAVLVGSDCPLLDQNYVEQAFTALDRGLDLVVGPAGDGGYVLVGMRRPYPLIFTNIEWGSQNVLAQTRAHIRSSGLNCRELPVLWDIDRIEDLERMGASLSNHLVSSRLASLCRKYTNRSIAFSATLSNISN